MLISLKSFIDKKILLRHFFILIKATDQLLNVLVDRQVRAGAHLDMHRVLLAEIQSQVLDFPGPSGRKKSCLPIRTDLVHDPPHLRLESHVFRGLASNKPIPSIRSASSITRNVTRFKFVLFCSSRSIILPGVATMISTPRINENSCPFLSVPP
jgi:hypothetical protein